MEKHNLKNSWILWEHQNSVSMNYEQSTRKLGEFSSIEDFWCYYNNYPSPSQIFYNGSSKPRLSNPIREISSISLFKKGIEPKWEDKANRDGGDLAIRTFNSLVELDEMWELFSVLAIGELFSHSSGVNGIRIVDSSIPAKKILYRIELWFNNRTLKSSIEQDIKFFFKLDKSRELFYKEHSTAVETQTVRKNVNNIKKRYH